MAAVETVEDGTFYPEEQLIDWIVAHNMSVAKFAWGANLPLRTVENVLD